MGSNIKENTNTIRGHDDSGSASRFFKSCQYSEDDLNDYNRFVYCGKATKKDRNSGNVVNNHPTIKPTSLLQYLCRMITPPGGVILDPFMGSGSTGKAAKKEGFGFVGIEMDEEYFNIAKQRINDSR